MDKYEGPESKRAFGRTAMSKEEIEQREEVEQERVGE